MPLGDLSSSLHGLADRSRLADWLVTVSAQDLVYLAPAVLLLLWLRPKGLRACIAAVGGALVALGIAALLGSLHDEARPFVSGHYRPLFAHSADGSFPSDHLSALGAVTAGAWLGWRRLGIAAACLSLVVGVARVIAGVHYVDDVVAGFLVGVASALAVWVLTVALRPLLAIVELRLAMLHLRPRRPPRTR